MNLNKDTIIIFKEKYSDRYFSIPTENDLYAVAWKIFNERKDEGWYDVDEEFYDLYKSALKGEKNTWRYLQARQDFEYEGYEIIELEDV